MERIDCYSNQLSRTCLFGTPVDYTENKSLGTKVSANEMVDTQTGGTYNSKGAIKMGYTEYLGVGTGQYFNFLMAAFGLGLLIWCSRKNHASLAVNRAPLAGEAPGKTKRCVNEIILCLKRAVLVAILLFSLSIPSSWIHGVLKEYRDCKSIQQAAANSIPPQRYRESIRSLIPDSILNQARPRVPLIGL